MGVTAALGAASGWRVFSARACENKCLLVHLVQLSELSQLLWVGLLSIAAVCVAAAGAVRSLDVQCNYK